MKIGYVQFEPALGDLDETLRRLTPLLAEGRDADVLVLPELCNSGYNFTSRKQALDASETIAESRFLHHLEEECRRFSLHIVTGFNEREGDVLYNSAVLVGPRGVLGTYRKLHLFLNEKDFFAPGDAGLPVFDLGSFRLGMLVCFDWTFPEVWRILALKGADIICHPSNLVLPDLAQRSVPIHALVNRVFTVTANRIGREGDFTFTGRSVICDPRGNVLAEGSAEAEEVRIVEIDSAAARDKAVNVRNDLFADRRPIEYKGILLAASP